MYRVRVFVCFSLLILYAYGSEAAVHALVKLSKLKQSHVTCLGVFCLQ